MKDTPIHVGEQYAKLITAELINLGVSFTIDASTDKHGRVFTIGTDGRGELVSEICRIVSERLARAAAYSHQAANYGTTGLGDEGRELAREFNRLTATQQDEATRASITSLFRAHPQCTCQSFPGKPTPAHHHPQCPAYKE